MRILIMSVLGFLYSTIVFGQEIFPLITDYPSMAGSQSSMVLYYLIRNNERRLATEANRFNTEYAQRSAYLNSPLTRMITNEINKETKETLQRYQLLYKRNNELSVFHYSQKKQNKKELVIIERVLVNLKNELDKQHSTNVMLGEKMNLYQNAMASIHKIQRKMDEIDDTIDRSLILNRVLGRY